jgi:hypothetical protein
MGATFSLHVPKFNNFCRGTIWYGLVPLLVQYLCSFLITFSFASKLYALCLVGMAAMYHL